MKTTILVLGCIGLLGVWNVIAAEDPMQTEQTPQMQRSSDEPTQHSTLDIQKIQQITGYKGQFRDNVLTLRLPPRVPNVCVGGITLPSPMGLSTSVFFKSAGNTTLVSGDLVLLQNQVNPVIDAALNNNLQVTALHSNFLWDTPRIMSLHITGTGATDQLATAVNKVFSRIEQEAKSFPSAMKESGMRESKCPRACPSDGSTCSEENGSQNACPAESSACPTEESGACPTARTRGTCPSSAARENGGQDLSTTGVDATRTNLDSAKLRNLLGTGSHEDRGTLIFTFGKTTSMSGHAFDRTMGIGSWAAFAGTNNKAVVNGDIAAYEHELQGVLKALRQADINILAIGNHLTSESPRVLFVHYMGIGRSTELATGIRNALNLTRGAEEKEMSGENR